MKSFILFLFTISVFFMSCKQSENTKVNNTIIICGKIEKPTSNIITIFYTKGFDQVTDSAKVDSNGTFKMVLPISYEHLCKLGHGPEYTRIYRQKISPDYPKSATALQTD